jgi:hypothetical protein
MRNRRSFVAPELGMRTKSRFTLNWTGNALIFWVFLIFIPSFCAKGQALPGSGLSSPGYELARSSFEGRYGTLITGFNPSLHPRLSFPDLNVDRLPEISKREFGGSDSAVGIQPTIESKLDTNVQWRPAIQESLLYTGIMHTFNIWTVTL